MFGFGFKAPAPWAVFVNGSLGHMLDYDDVGAGGHVGIATVPVAFAVAEALGRVSGRDLITAIAAGTDLHTRLDLAVRLPDWTMTEGIAELLLQLVDRRGRITAKLGGCAVGADCVELHCLLRRIDADEAVQ